MNTPRRIYDVDIELDVNLIAGEKGLAISTKAAFVVAIKQVGNEALDSLQNGVSVSRT
jgi:hypothetical protein